MWKGLCLRSKLVKTSSFFNMYIYISPDINLAFQGFMCATVETPYIGDGHPTFNRNPYPYNGYISPYYKVDDHPLLYGKNGSLDPGTCSILRKGTKSVGGCLSTRL